MQFYSAVVATNRTVAISTNTEESSYEEAESWTECGDHAAAGIACGDDVVHLGVLRLSVCLEPDSTEAYSQLRAQGLFQEALGDHKR